MAKDNYAALNIERYQRQLALPEIGPRQQERLLRSKIIVVGAGGLGCAALPYLCGAGVGSITIIDHDTVSLSNLHRQTLFAQADIGENKAALAAQKMQALNPEIEITPIDQRITSDNALSITEGADIILDGSDNFETKSLLNAVSIQTGIPLISASVNQWQGQIGYFNGYYKDAPCYHCLFQELPGDARNCNEAGILGTSAGMTGMYQAHMALCALLGLDFCAPGDILTFDFKTLRQTRLKLAKDPNCVHCRNAQNEKKEHDMSSDKPIELVHPKDLQGDDVLIVDVRTQEELDEKSYPGALHMELTTVPSRYQELPKDKRLAFVCAGNVRSAQAAAFVQAMGYENICIYDALT